MAVRCAVLLAVAAFALVGFPLVVQLPGPADQGTAVYAAMAASPARGNDNNDHGQVANDNRGEFQIEGAVLPVRCPDQFGQAIPVCGDRRGVTIPAINRDANPPEIYVHNVGGPVRVVFGNPASLDQFQEAQYVRIGGRWIERFLFEAGGGEVDVVLSPALQQGGSDTATAGNDNDDGNGNDND